MDTPGSPGQSWEMRLASARRLRGLALCSPLLPSVIRLPQSSQGELKRNVLIMSLLFTTFQWLPTALRMKSELSPRAVRPPSPISPGPSTLLTAPRLESPGCPQIPQVPLRE